MTKIFELKQQQHETIHELEWLADNDDEVEVIKAKLASIKGEVHSKLDYWLPVLAEVKGNIELSKEAKRIAVTQHDRNIKRKEKVKEWVENHVVSLMVDFKIDKHKGSLFNASHYLSPGSLVISGAFDAWAVPDKYTTEVPVTLIPNKEAIKEELKRTPSKDPCLVTNDNIPGCWLERKEILRIS